MAAAATSDAEREMNEKKTANHSNFCTRYVCYNNRGVRLIKVFCTVGISLRRAKRGTYVYSEISYL